MSTVDEKAQKELKDIEMAEFFTDDEFEDELMDATTETTVTTETTTTVTTDINAPVVDQKQFDIQNPVFLYRMFYHSFFPYKTYFNWLNYDTMPTKNFTHREFSFTLPGDIYSRFRSFATMEELRKEIERMQPTKIDIGAIYSVKPKDKKTVAEKAFKPLEKELVFDIDMTDYDDIRTCCSGGDICNLCWKFMTVAMKIIDASLKEDFGFKHIMWVYSGRRGVHCWVCDERARKLNNDTRKAIVDFMNVIKGGAQTTRKVKLPYVLHPSLKRSLTFVDEYFEDIILKNMGILDTPETSKKLLEIIPDQAAREKIESLWDTTKPAKKKWEDIVTTMSNVEKKKKFKDNVPRDIMFQYCYPRLDVKVTTGINHLLKSPFCVHPKTLKVCVPIKIEECDDFDPLTVPTLISIKTESDAYNKDNDSEEKIADYKKTSLKPYYEYFEKFVMNMIMEVKRNKRDEADRSMEF